MGWSAEVWDRAQDIYVRILNHPFVKGLAEGTLPREAFLRYIAQDELYLRNYAAEMEQVAGMVPEARDLLMGLATDGVAAEQAMHGNVEVVDPSPATLAYARHVTSCIRSGCPAVAFASILPCTWLYNEVGLHIYRIGYRADNPYRKWIATYSAEEYTAQATQLTATADRMAAMADDDTRRAMTDAFLRSAECELAFWEYGWSG